MWGKAPSHFITLSSFIATANPLWGHPKLQFYIDVWPAGALTVAIINSPCTGASLPCTGLM